VVFLVTKKRLKKPVVSSLSKVSCPHQLIFLYIYTYSQYKIEKIGHCGQCRQLSRINKHFFGVQSVQGVRTVHTIQFVFQALFFFFFEKCVDRCGQLRINCTVVKTRKKQRIKNKKLINKNGGKNIKWKTKIQKIKPAKINSLYGNYWACSQECARTQEIMARLDDMIDSIDQIGRTIEKNGNR